MIVGSSAFQSSNTPQGNLARQAVLKELFDIFPESMAIVQDKLKELGRKKKEIEDTIRESLGLIRARCKDSFSQWFWSEVVRLDAEPELKEVERRLFHWRGLKSRLEGKPLYTKDTRQNVPFAKEIPILSVVEQKTRLRKVGRNYTGKCPFHKERYPSFYVYPNTNSFYCFGCAKGGDVIRFVELTEGLSFMEAVKRLCDLGRRG